MRDRRSGLGGSEGCFGWGLTNTCFSLPLRLDRRILHILSNAPFLGRANSVRMLPSALLRDLIGRQPLVG